MVSIKIVLTQTYPVIFIIKIMNIIYNNPVFNRLMGLKYPGSIKILSNIGYKEGLKYGAARNGIVLRKESIFSDPNPP
jgi:hypothetical protein